MLTKLFKLDFKWIYKYFPFYLLGILFCTLLNLLFFHLPRTPFTSFIIAYILPNLILSLLISGLANIFVRSIVRFKRNFYRDESYLTHTLPVEKSDLFRAKVLAAFSTLPIAGLTILLVAPCMSLNFATFFSSLWDFYKLYPLETLLTPLLTFLEFAFIYLCCFTGILLGHRKSSHKTLHSTLITLGLYFGTILIFFGTLRLLSLALPDLAVLFSKTEISPASALAGVTPALLTSTIFYVLVSLALYLLGQKTFQNGLDVE